ncbi:MAG: hypothetical protein ABIV28_02155 [Longimicrobiales bacterium]
MIREGGASHEIAALANASLKTLEKMQSGLILLLGGAGFAALVTRALKLAKRQHAVLTGVSIDPATFAPQGLAASLHESQPEELLAASAAIPQHMLELLVTLLGEDVGLLPIAKIWPDLAPPAPAPSLTETAE